MYLVEVSSIQQRIGLVRREDLRAADLCTSITARRLTWSLVKLPAALCQDGAAYIQHVHRSGIPFCVGALKHGPRTEKRVSLYPICWVI